MRRVVLVGANGYLGSALAAGLSRAGDLDVVPFLRGRRADPDRPPLDLLDPAGMAAALKDASPDIVINAAGRIRGTARELYQDNAALAATLAEAILQAAPDAVLFQLGSAAEYGRPRAGAPLREEDPCRPVGLYGFAKLAAARYLFHCRDRRGLRLNHLRVFNPVGATNSENQVVGAFIARAKALAPPKRVQMGRLDAVRDFVALDDLVALTLRLIRGEASGQVVNVCSGEGRRVRDLLRHVASRSPDPVAIEESGPAPAPGQEDVIVGDPTRFLALAGLARPSPVEAALADVWDVRRPSGRSTMRSPEAGS